MNIRKCIILLMCLIGCTKDPTGLITVDPVVFSITSGVYNDTQIITMECPTEGSRIHYSTTVPWVDSEDRLYTDPLQVSSDTDIYAKAYHAQGNPSAVNSVSIQVDIDPNDFTSSTIPSCLFNTSWWGNGFMSFSEGQLCTQYGDYTTSMDYNVVSCLQYNGLYRVLTRHWIWGSGGDYDDYTFFIRYPSATHVDVSRVYGQSFTPGTFTTWRSEY